MSYVNDHKIKIIWAKGPTSLVPWVKLPASLGQGAGQLGLAPPLPGYPNRGRYSTCMNHLIFIRLPHVRNSLPF